jgi:hypothetical protein
VVDFDPKDLKVVSDIQFEFDGETWEVMTYDDAIERTRDHLRDSFDDYFFSQKISEILVWGIITKESFMEIFNIDEDEMEEEGWDLEDYIENVMGIKTISDFDKFLINRTNRTWDWYYENVNIEEVIEYFGGEYPAMEFALARYDNVLHEDGDYIIYRTD